MITDSMIDLINKLPIPMLIIQTIRNVDKKIIDAEITYTNEQYRLQTKDFVIVGDKYSNIEKKLPPESKLFQIFLNLLLDGKTYEGEYLDTKLHVWFHITMQKRDKDSCILLLQNINTIKIQQKYLDFLEMNDKKTGLNNSLRFYDELDEGLRKAELNNSRLYLLILDIDDLCEINDFTGREAGDLCIKTVADILLSLENNNISVYRLEGDEFAIIYSNVQKHSDILSFIDDIRINIRKTGFSVSTGISIYPTHDINSRGMLKDADIALHYVKIKDKGNYAFFSSEMYDKFLERVNIQNKIAIGLEKNQFCLYYQPQFNLNGHTLRGFEALLRWKDDDGKILMPQSFIPIAEKTNIMQVLGFWILKTAIYQLKKWQDEFSFTGIISVNVSPIQLKSTTFVSELEELVLESGINADALEIEITEGVFITDIKRIVEKLNRIKKMGIKISLDDFGTGYSSLRYLSNMPINTLKLDKSFIDSIEEGNTLNIDILSSIIPVIRNAGMETIAEGVEEPTILSILTDIDCNCVQGFLWGKPITVEKCERYLCGDNEALEKIH